MTDLLITATELRGTVTPPPFKSEVIRFLILSALCGIRPSSVIPLSEENCGDINAAIEGIDFAFFSNAGSAIPVGDSAALLRLLAPLMISRSGKAVFSVGKSLFRREIFAGYSDLGWEYSKHSEGESLLVSVSGRIEPSKIRIDASESSQTASGLLLCLPVVPGLAVSFTDPVSMPYIELTLRLLREFGAGVKLSADGYYYSDCGMLVPPSGYGFQPDYSYAAAFAAMNFLLSGDSFRPIDITENESSSVQPDYALHRLLHEAQVSVRDCPDLFPLLCVCALKKAGDTVITGTARLKTKESDRVFSTGRMLEAIGGGMDAFSDHVVVHGCGGRMLPGGEVDPCGDHRIVMAAAAASLLCKAPVIIRGADAVGKSAPGFFKDFERLGGTVHELIRE